MGGCVVLLSALIFIIDLNLSLGVAAGVAYILPVLVASRIPGNQFVILTAVVCTGLTTMGLYYSPAGGEMWQVLQNRALSLFVIWTATWFRIAEKKATTIMQQQYALLSAINEGTTDSISAKDLQGRYTVINKAGADYIGKWENDIIGKDDTALFPPEIAQRLMDLDQRAIESGNVVVSTEKYQTGSMPEYIDDVRAPIRDTAGNIIGTFGVLRDVTEQRKAEETLRKSKQQLLEAQRIAHIGFWERDPVEDTMFFSDELHMIYGITPEELGAIEFSTLERKLYHPDDYERVVQHFETVIRDNTTCNIEYRILRPDGEVRHVHVRGEVLGGDSGAPLRLFGTVMDITERKQAEIAIQSSEEKFRQLVEDTNVLSWEADIEALQFSYISPQAEIITGFTSEQWCQPNFWLQHIHAEDRDWVTRHCQECTEKLEDHVFEYRLVKSDGEIIWIHDSVKIIYNEQGKATKLRGVMIDITERRQAEGKLKESEEQTRLILENSLDAFVSINADNKVIGWNKQSENIFGWTVDEAIGRTLSELIIPASLRKSHQQGMSQFLEMGMSKIMNKHVEIDALHKDGRELPVELSITTNATFNQKENVIFHAFIRDITERKQAEEELQKLSRAVEASSSVIMITDLEGNIEYVNPKFTEVTGYTREESIGETPRLLKSGETPEGVYVGLWETILAGNEWKGEFHNRKKDGSHYWSRASISGVRDATGEITHFITIQDDVTHEYELTERLSYQASHDDLTGLANRGEFGRRAERLLSTIRQDKDEHALCYMDLDQFKIVNDTCGHMAGDELLRQLGAVLQREVRKRDTLARLGGDEFGVLMEHCSLGHAQRVADSLQKAIRDYQFSWDGHVFKLGVSIGLVAITDAIPNLSELMKQADAACYMAKDLGRNRIHVYRPEDTELAQRHGEMQWVARIHQALEENRFRLYAQSIVALDRSDDVHYELLIRMEDEEGQLIPPGAFLPAAERYNLIEKLDCWVVEQAFALLAAYPVFQNQINFISINLSGQSLTTPGVLDFILTQLEVSGVEADKICFEITETAAIAHLSTAIKFISTLRGRGCRFALDDFGSGLSSFAYLKNLSVDYLKIDGMFVRDMVDDPIDRAMVKSINEIGQVMGMQTIAEFVENDEIKGMLREIGVNYAQGYGIDKPRSFDELLGSPKYACHQTGN